MEFTNAHVHDDDVEVQNALADWLNQLDITPSRVRGYSATFVNLGVSSAKRLARELKNVSNEDEQKDILEKKYGFDKFDAEEVLLSLQGNGLFAGKNITASEDKDPSASSAGAEEEEEEEEEENDDALKTISPPTLNRTDSVISRFSCPICFDIMIERSHRPVTLGGCGHSMCYSCLKHHFREKDVCPICRTKVPEDQRTHLAINHILRETIERMYPELLYSAAAKAEAASKHASAMKKKAEGNEYFKSGQYHDAIAKYTEAIELHQNDPTFFCNRSACYAKLRKWRLAAYDGVRCTDIDERFLKGYIRAAFAYINLHESDAKTYVFRGLELAPLDATLLAYKAQIPHMNRGNDHVSIGIDFGTNYARVGIFRKGAFQLIPNDDNISEGLPVIVRYNDEDDPDVCEDFLTTSSQGTPNIITSLRRLLCGPRFGVSRAEIKPDELPSHLLSNAVNRLNLPLLVAEFDDDSHASSCFVLNNGKRKVSPEEVLAVILSKLKLSAEKFLGFVVTNAVISVPPFFESDESTVILSAADRVGLSVIRLTCDNVLCFESELSLSHTNQRNIIFDIGGGYTSATGASVEAGISEMIDFQSIDLGGEDFTSFIVEYSLRNLPYDKALLSDKALRRLRIACNQAKHELSTNREASIEVSNFHNDTNLNIIITREIFDNICDGYFRSCIGVLTTLFNRRCGVGKNITNLVVRGGSSRIPKLRELIGKCIEDNHVAISGRVAFRTSDDTVVRGASILAAKLSGCDDKLVQDTLILDVIRRSISVEANGGICETVLRKKLNIPAKKICTFGTCFNDETGGDKPYLNMTTGEDGLSSVTIRVFSGESAMAKDNKLICVLQFDHIPVIPEICPDIHVTIDIDANSKCSIVAEELNSNTKRTLHFFI